MKSNFQVTLFFFFFFFFKDFGLFWGAPFGGTSFFFPFFFFLTWFGKWKMPQTPNLVTESQCLFICWFSGPQKTSALINRPFPVRVQWMPRTFLAVIVSAIPSLSLSLSLSTFVIRQFHFSLITSAMPYYLNIKI